MKFFLQLQDADILPSGYGIIYQQPHRLGYLVCPMPFNLAIGLARRIYFWIASNPLSSRDYTCLRCYEAGRNETEMNIRKADAQEFIKWLRE